MDDIDSDEEDGEDDAEEELSAQVRCLVLVLLHAAQSDRSFSKTAESVGHPLCTIRMKVTTLLEDT